MARQSVLDMPVERVYPLLLQKAGRKGRTKEEVDAVIAWLTGYRMEEVDPSVPWGAFCENAPAWNPRADLIKGKICGVDIEGIEDPVMRRVRQLDKLIDELAKGRALEEVLR